MRYLENENFYSLSFKIYLLEHKKRGLNWKVGPCILNIERDAAISSVQEAMKSCNLQIATLGSILDSLLSWESGKFKLVKDCLTVGFVKLW